MLFWKLHRRTQKLSFEGLIITKERKRKASVLTIELVGLRRAVDYMISEQRAAVWKKVKGSSQRKRLNGAAGETIHRKWLPHQRSWKPLERPPAQHLTASRLLLCPTQLAQLSILNSLHLPARTTPFSPVQPFDRQDARFARRPAPVNTAARLTNARQSTKQSRVRDALSRHL